MYICVCNALTERAVEAAIRTPGVERADDVYETLGCAPVCGTCRTLMDDMIADARCPADA